jgi:hypothetical protein
MSNRLLTAAAALALLAVPFAVQAQGTPAQQSGAAAGATTGAIGGAIVGGPVGAVVGGAVGAVVGGTLAPQEQVAVRQYVVRQSVPSVRVQEQVVVGAPLPQTVQLHAIPADVGVQTQYRYSVVNDQTVLVDPSTRRVVQVLQ